MFNLSDKDLDRLSQEAAQQHEPGDIVGPRFWDKLEARLDRDLGKMTPNPARGIRRLPYYYAPALLMMLGVTYYLVRPGNKSHKGTSSGSPPFTVIQPATADPLKPVSSSPNPVSADKLNSTSTPTAPSATVPYPGTAGASAGTHAPAATAHPDVPESSASSAFSASSASHASSRPNTSLTTTTNSRTSFRKHHHQDRLATGTAGVPTSRDNTASTHNTSISTDGSTSPNNTAFANTTATPTSPRDPAFSAVRKPIRLGKRGPVDDSALRAFTLSSIHQPIHRALHINRSLVLGVMGGPDYASVNSVAGDRPGSTFGLTVDYQIASHWYIGSGLLFSRKVFAVLPQDYHVPLDYYNTNGMGMGGGIDYVKGTFSMLEVPLNLRYDFSNFGNTLFFLSAGSSSYFFPSENCGYYFSLWNPRATQYRKFTYANQPSDLFATLNFSMGAEFGISNSLSVMVAPYIKVPTRGIGFGQVQLNSFGINFAVRFAPILSRRR